MRFLLILILSQTIVFSEDYSGLVETMSKYSTIDTKHTMEILPEKYKNIKEATQKNDDSQYTILYFFSDSVPPISFAKLLLDIADNNSKNKIKLRTSQSLIGVNMNLKKYIIDIRSHLKKSPLAKDAIGLIDIRMSPQMFEDLKINRVPMIALASCIEGVHPSECSVLAAANGDITLSYFFEKLNEENITLKGINE